MNLSVVTTASLLMLGMLGALFTFNFPSTLAQPCENNGHNVLGSDKQIMSQSNRCIIINNIPQSPPSTGICGPNSVLQNGVCVPMSSTCPSGTMLQNNVCVTITCPPGSILQNGICVPFTNPVQSAPVANAGPSQSVQGNTVVTLDGSGSFATTSGATIKSYQWTQTTEPFVTLSNANTAFPTFTAPTTSTAFTLTFSVTVTDSLGQTSSPSTVTITVNPNTTQ